MPGDFLKGWTLRSSTSPTSCLPSLFRPTIQEYEELVWLVGNLKLEVTNYSRNLYGPRGAAYPGGGDDDDDDDGGGGGDEEDSEATPSYQSRKRRHH
ncbi:hypothetical protein SO802_023281 [Lithocarpus litseifolius]|uniref:Uncharacterized protein n=1 Tax=Lithocarpus litseifolius TaxID=425828 RepID=A0AAW2C6K3_9ROSI